TATPLSVPAVPATSAIQGRFLWYDLMTPDPDAAITFYTAVLGWGTQPFQQADGSESYTMWTANGTPLGGVMTLTPEMLARSVPAHWLCYVGTENVAATVETTKALGGRVLKDAFDIPSVGTVAVLADPMGAAFAAYRPSMPVDTPDETAKVGEIGWIEILTTDYQRAFDFYHALFGWELSEDMDMGGGEIYRLFARNGRRLGGIFNRPAFMSQVPPNLGIYVRVDDVHATVARVQANGGVLANGPMEVPGGDWIANCFDPQGGAFSVLHSKGT
ncbi:MAG TPA: VOC family protein, partial [Gemmatimonadaceae bacterium]|nr:VOC family protein [Gemmatimonadaceae bacterium]